MSREVALTSLSIAEFTLVSNAIGFAIVCMFGTTLYFMMSRSDVARPYRPAVTTSALVTFIAGIIYLQIWSDWKAGHQLRGELYVPSASMPFTDIYRYVDWMLTVPLLCASLILSLNLPDKDRKSLMPKLTVSAAMMIVLGYAGEVTGDTFSKFMLGTMSGLPFFYIISVLWGGLDKAVRGQATPVRQAMARARLVLFVSWLFYPTVYFFSLLGFTDSLSKVVLEVGYSAADIAAKCGYGLTVFAIVREKMKASGEDVDAVTRVSVVGSVPVPVMLAPPPPLPAPLPEDMIPRAENVVARMNGPLR
jgi:bacteriorhodopsin